MKRASYPFPAGPTHPWMAAILGAAGILGAAAAAAAAAEPAPAPAFFRQVQFRRGDVNADGQVNITDAIGALESLFVDGEELGCLAAADANADARVDVSDPISTLRFLFQGGPRPPPPGPSACGVDPRSPGLGCEVHPACPDDFPLIAHVLHRITFGPTEELYSRIQTRADLLRYIDEQLDQAPPAYDPAVHEPELHARIQSLGIGVPPEGRGGQLARLKSSLILLATESRWQLLHVLAQFWNNHFHTQIDALVDNFFREPPRGGPALQASAAMFAAADAGADGNLSADEWNAFRSLHPGAVPWEDFQREAADGAVTLEEFLDHRGIAGWKYWRRAEQAAAAAALEQREYETYRRLALGGFRDLITTCAKSAAMLIYLNGFENTVAAPNENFAREILELFSAGVDNVYTQRDIEELAKVFTGWTVDWVARAPYPAGDLDFQGLPGSAVYPLNLREPRPFRFPTRQFWEDDLYTWAFVIRVPQHDWGRKDLFLERYGGADSLGNPLPPSAGLAIPANAADRTVEAALAEFEGFLDRLMGFRDTAKFISTKLIQLFVTDDLSLLARERPLPTGLEAAFAAVDTDASGAIEPAEWEAPVPLVLPNGRPPQVFDRLDADGDGRITRREYQEPDLLQQSIEVWTASGGDMKEVLRAILHSDEFLSLKFRRAKVKTPFEVVTSAIRALDGNPSAGELNATAGDLLAAGMELFNFADPTGEPEGGIDWMHTTGLLARLEYLNRAANPVNQQSRRFTWSPTAIQSRWRLATPEDIADYFILLLHAGDVLPNQRLLALEVLGSGGAPNVRAAVGFLLSLPQFQKQ